MRCCLAFFLVLAAAAPLPAWESARPGWRYEFPRDHGAHRDFKTEWWYFTGNVRDAKSGREFGYELTFFRQGIRPPGERRPAAAEGEGSPRSRFATDDFRFAHFAVTDLAGGGTFHHDAKMSRGAFGEAGSGDPAKPGEALAWMDDWSLTPQADGTWRIAARAGKIELDLILRPAKPPVIHGENGVSQKSLGDGNASHYYSFTRLETSGRLGVDGTSFEVGGTSWFDHEWASNQLGVNEVGWDWFCVQFDDGTDLMLYGLRRRDGTISETSSGTLVDAAGNATHVRRGGIRAAPARALEIPAHRRRLSRGVGDQHSRARPRAAPGDAPARARAGAGRRELLGRRDPRDRHARRPADPWRRLPGADRIRGRAGRAAVRGPGRGTHRSYTSYRSYMSYMSYAPHGPT